MVPKIKGQGPAKVKFQIGSHKPQTWWDGVTQPSARANLFVFWVTKVKGQCPAKVKFQIGSHEPRTWLHDVAQLSAEPFFILVTKVKGQYPNKVKWQSQISNCSHPAEIWYEGIT